MLKLTTDDGAVILPVKVVPGASRTRHQGVLDGRAKIAVAAPPEKGKANDALVEYLAQLLGIRKRNVTVVAGHTSTRKKIRIEQVTVNAVRDALEPTRP